MVGLDSGKKVFQHVSLEFKWTRVWRNESWSRRQHQRRSDVSATGRREPSAAALSSSWSWSSVSLSDKRNHHQDLHHIFLMDGHNQDSSESYSYESIVRVSILSLLFTLATSGKLGNQTSRSNDWSKIVPLSDSWTEATETKMELEFDLIFRQLSRPALTPMWRRFWYLQVFDSFAKKVISSKKRLK